MNVLFKNHTWPSQKVKLYRISGELKEEEEEEIPDSTRIIFHLKKSGSKFNRSIDIIDRASRPRDTLAFKKRANT